MLFGPKLRKDLPAIDITKKPVKGMFGRVKYVYRSKPEQRKLKRELMQRYPDRYFVDELHERNSLDPNDILTWYGDIELLDMLLDP